MPGLVRRLCRDRSAVTAIEYSLIVCLIATAAIGAFSRVGHSMVSILGITTNAMH